MSMFRKKPVVIEAVLWAGDNLRDVIAFTDGPPDTRTNHAGMMWENYENLVKRDGLKIFTLEGKMSADVGDWIIKGVKGEHYPCKPDVFEMTYEPADGQAQLSLNDDDLDRIATILNRHESGEIGLQGVAEEILATFDRQAQQSYAWTPGPDEFKDWCANWFGQDSDESYLAKAVFNLPPMAQKFSRSFAQQDTEKVDAQPAVAVPMCHKCGTPMVRNPHPDAGRMDRMLEVGCPMECLPCTVLSRHQWAGRAMAAETELRKSKPDPAMAGDELLTESWYDLAWCHSAHPRKLGEELRSLTFTPDEFEDFCRALLKRVQPASGEDA